MQFVGRRVGGGVPISNVPGRQRCVHAMQARLLPHIQSVGHNSAQVAISTSARLHACRRAFELAHSTAYLFAGCRPLTGGSAALRWRAPL